MAEQPFVDRLPRPIYVGLREAYRLYKYVRWSFRRHNGMDPFDYVPGWRYRALLWEITTRPHEHLLHIPLVRRRIAHQRARRLFIKGKVARAAESDKLIHNALEYNLEAAKSAPDLDRPMVMVNVATSIQRIANRIQDVDVLSIGPRSEIELFGIRAGGFSASRIKALDLFSYSPFVDAGDMHAMPYADNSFDLVFLGWVLAYSKSPDVAAREVVRVCRPGAVVIASGDYIEPSTLNPEIRQIFNDEATVIRSVDQILGYFGTSVERVYFCHDPEPPNVQMVMTAFAVQKPAPAV